MMKNLLVFLFALLYINVTQAQTQIFVGDVTNGIKIGPMIGNKNLILGLRNIAEEAFMDKGFDIEIVYFDILSTNAGVSVFHKTNAETIIRIKGYLVKDGKKVKEYLATGKSSEISTSTMVIDEGGGINQQAARSALKKTIIELIDKLTI
jgi:hypothetical protein